MAVALPGLPSLLPAKLYLGCQHQHATSLSANPSRRCTRLPCIYCCAQSSGDDGPSTSSSSWAQEPGKDSYAGWSFLDNGKRKKLSGFLQVGAGVALAVGFALVSNACWKRGVGSKVDLVPPPPAYEETYVTESTKVKEAGAAQEVEDEEESPVDVQSTENAEEEEEQEVAADAPVATPHQPDTTTGQVSFPSDTIEDSEAGVVSSPASGGAASTFGYENTGEELSRTDTESGEDLSTPATDLAVDSVSDDLKSPDSDATPESSAGTADSTYSVESSSPEEPESVSSESSAPVALPSEDEVVVASEKPDVLLASVDLTEDSNTAVHGAEVPLPQESDREVELVESVTASPGLSVSEQDEPFSSSEVGATPVENAADMVLSQEDEISRITSSLDKVSPSSESEFWQIVIPAPSAPSALPSGRVLIAPVVDHGQEQALSALQSLKVVEPGVGASTICTRREYARWLVAANRTLARNTGAKVSPAMYIEKVTEAAFDDVSPEDPDFPFIQGLAEAGLIFSKLSRGPDSDGPIHFLPDRPLSRQDLISWKFAVENHSLPVANRNKLQERFIDIDNIHTDVWPAIAADVAAGDRSIISSAFGYTRLFQPHKPVTTGQAAVALSSGEASEHIGEELERLEAERHAEKAVAAEIALEARAQKEANAVFREELDRQRQLTVEAEAVAERLREELEKLKSEREEEKYGVMKERASLDAAKEALSRARLEVDDLLQGLSSEKVKVVFERDRMEKLLAEIEEERDTLENVKSETQVEKKALVLARTWAEEEAKKAMAHAKVLEEARKRWESQGIEVHVDKDLDDSNIPVPSWQFEKLELQDTSQQAKPPMHGILVKADEFKGRSLQFLREAMQTSNQRLSVAQQRMLESMEKIARKAGEVRDNTFFVVRKRAGEAQSAAASMASEISALVAKNTNKLADGCKGSAEKLAQIFKP
ncbi:uncharacterized protein LOC9632043 isoform X1 [Selaginella moellendorffii]|uniref:uncharacterized protein LOC9632043 isoform X1 n=1 Tax=Selaginella moellendorffii TaxID=88036 RepID=UPI000D1CEB3A|nr:uncharacterized protein LOC9632043 isoform X1 [Selaginella moellendorffii]|eukprot:XP_024530410.1 uncharacterized protein LOC9632043 isoform X1 [Selaginella moellendorffii]